MSFRCDFCNETSKKGVSPILHTTSRLKEYTVEREDDNGDKTTDVVVGSEIVSQKRVCPTCAGVEVKEQPIPNYSGYRAYTFGAQKHTRGCKKPLDDCKACKSVVAYFSLFPAPALSFAVEDVKVEHKFSLASIVMENLIDRSKDASKRGALDFAAGFNLLKQYEKTGGGL